MWFEQASPNDWMECSNVQDAREKKQKILLQKIMMTKNATPILGNLELGQDAMEFAP